MKLNTIKANPDNPRVLRDDKFKKLLASLRNFPEMMEKRPIVVDEQGMILGGNMRFRALQDIYGKSGEIPDAWVTVATGWTEEMKREFVIKDNASFGEWDWDALANDWDAGDLAAWGVDFPSDWESNMGEETPTTQKRDDAEINTGNDTILPMTFKFTIDQFSYVSAELGNDKEGKLLELLGYEQE